MTGRGPVTIRGLARELGRDVKGVHGDVHALLDAGVLDRTEEGRILFPYDAVHVDFELAAARVAPTPAQGRAVHGGCARARIPLNRQKEGQKHPPKAAGPGYLGV